VAFQALVCRSYRRMYRLVTIRREEATSGAGR
jgi:hypothetical protein